MKKLLLCVVFAFSICFVANAQEEEKESVVTENPADIKDDKVLSMDELKAERAALIAMVKSEEFQKKLAKVEGAKVQNDIGIAGLDALTGVVTTMLSQLRENRNMIPQLYASVTGQTIDGAAAGDVKKLSPDQLVTFSKLFIQMGTTLVKSSKDLLSLPQEIKSAGVMKALKGAKSLLYLKSAIGVIKQEITYNSKMVKNLIATNKLNNPAAGSK